MRWLPLFRLMRLPNVFTSFADVSVGVGVMASTNSDTSILSIGMLFAASGLLYLSGMVWNDFFDYAEDLRDRPHRPLPAGQFTRRFAFILASALMLAGLLAAWVAGGAALPMALSIAAAILLYDAWLKHFWIGPLSMASCRFLNVLLGLSLLDGDTLSMSLRLHLASIIGIYIVGVTWFARTEATRSHRSSLIAAAGVMGIAILVALAIPTQLDAGTVSIWFPYGLALFAWGIAGPLIHAIRQLGPVPVQRAVKRTILGLIALDAMIAVAFVGLAGFLVLFWLLPAWIVGKWVYST